IALLSIPALVALRHFRSLGAIVAAGCVVALAMSLTGLALAQRLDRPPGPAIVLIGAVLLGLSRLLSPALRRGRPAR
ncbi:MAG TPA: metal ABC transporter permease, partial [Thermoanaerobaculia bacterium]|nr:metal ABC transporter permease [Thermoanaerobaculia bacterium]